MSGIETCQSYQLKANERCLACLAGRYQTHTQASLLTPALRKTVACNKPVKRPDHIGAQLYSVEPSKNPSNIIAVTLLRTMSGRSAHGSSEGGHVSECHREKAKHLSTFASRLKDHLSCESPVCTREPIDCTYMCPAPGLDG